MADDIFGPIDELVLPPDLSRILWWTSWLTFGSGLYAVWRGAYGLAVLTMAIFLTSINYWRWPDRGLRRYVDMTVVQVGLVGHLVAAVAVGSWGYCLLTGLGAACYLVGEAAHRRGPEGWRASTAWHAGLHVLANIGNLVLYAVL